MSIYKGKMLKRSAGILLAVVMMIGAAENTLAAGSCKKVSQVGSYGMMPVYERDIESGVYDVDTQTTSTYFRLHDPQLTVAHDGMTLEFYIDSKSYGYIYPGTPEEAEKASESDWIPADVRDGVSYFTIPVEALDSPIECAAYSTKKQQWYERQLMVLASSLPEEALDVELPDYEKIAKAMKLYEAEEEKKAEAEGAGEGAGEAAGEAVGEGTGESAGEGTGESVGEGAGEGAGGAAGESAGKTSGAAATEVETEIHAPEAISVDLPDGDYSIEVGMTGGSGRAMVTSPTSMTVKDGKAYATLLWSSANYDYMLIDGYRYDNETTDGGKSSFTLPITAMDEPVLMVGDTTAMDEPVEINYQFTFYRETIGDVGMIPQVAAKRVLLMALGLVVFGGILNWYVKRRLSRRK